MVFNTRLAIPSESAITICLGILSRGNFLKGYARSTEVLDSRGEAAAAAAAAGGDDDDDDGHTPIRYQPIYRDLCESLRKFDDR